jgi:hypothetical protein
MSGTTIDEKTWDGIVSKPKQASLSRSGVVRTLAHEILYGPLKYQGLGAPNPWLTQELTHLKDFVAEVSKETNFGKRIQISTKAHRLETGCPGPFTDVPFAPLQSSTTDSWIKGLWQTLQSFNISIQDNFGQLELSRDKDVFLIRTGVLRGSDGTRAGRHGTRSMSAYKRVRLK